MGKKNKGKRRLETSTNEQKQASRTLTSEGVEHPSEGGAERPIDGFPELDEHEQGSPHRNQSHDENLDAKAPDAGTVIPAELAALTDPTIEETPVTSEVQDQVKTGVTESAEQSLDDLIGPVPESISDANQNQSLKNHDQVAQQLDGDVHENETWSAVKPDQDFPHVLAALIRDENGSTQPDLGQAGNTHSPLHDLERECNALQKALEDRTTKLAQVSDEKAQVESQYRNLFSKVTQMKTTLGARLKQDSEELAQNRTLIEELESQNAVLNETVTHVQEQVVTISEQLSAADRGRHASDIKIQELTNVITNLEHSLAAEKHSRIAAAERDMMIAAERENIALEEKTARDTLRDRIHDLEEQLSAQNTAYQNLLSIVEQDNQANTKLKQNIYELQESHQDELRTVVGAMQATIDELRKDHKLAQDRTDQLKSQSNELQAELEKFRPYEREAKEKNLLIGKLRHEAVILNEHLTKALRLLKRGSSTDAVDRQLLNNLLLSFFQLPRQDSKRFEVLKILASVLAWDDLQKEQAGLVRPGSITHLLPPMSPSLGRSPPASPGVNRGSISRRTSGAIQLQAADFMGPNKESMSDLWINFLQTEAAMDAADAVDSK